MKIAWILFLLTGCALNTRGPSEEGAALFAALPKTKQRQKIASLHKKLEEAEKEQKKVAGEIERLQQDVQEAELALIRKQVDRYEEQIQKIEKDPAKYAALLRIESSTLFLKEREILHEMIQSGPSPAAFEAQAVLDRILRMITELSDCVVR